MQLNQRHRHMEQTDGCRRASRVWLKEGEGARQRACMNDPRTWTTVWGWTVWAGWREARGGEK